MPGTLGFSINPPGRTFPFGLVGDIGEGGTSNCASHAGNGGGGGGGGGAVVLNAVGGTLDGFGWTAIGGATGAAIGAGGGREVSPGKATLPGVDNSPGTAALDRGVEVTVVGLGRGTFAAGVVGAEAGAVLGAVLGVEVGAVKGLGKTVLGGGVEEIGVDLGKTTLAGGVEGKDVDFGGTGLKATFGGGGEDTVALAFVGVGLRCTLGKVLEWVVSTDIGVLGDSLSRVGKSTGEGSTKSRRAPKLGFFPPE